MGVFDFVRDVGAKVGIGKSTAEIEAEEAAEAQADADEAAALKAAKSAADKVRKARAAREADKKDEAEAAAKKREAFKARAAERRAAAAKRRHDEKQRSAALERYIKMLGLDDDGEVDIRFDDGVAYIEGVVPDQETREKIILSVGNAMGVARVDEELEVVTPEPEAVFHTVESGDTLWAVAQKVYGDGNRYPEIFEANQPMLTDPDLIFPGQVLRCPQ